MKYFLGLDPGKSGGYAILDLQGNIIETGITPVIGKTKKQYDIIGLKNIFIKYKYEIICIEKPGVIFGIGKTSMMNLGEGIGLLHGMTYMTDSRVISVAPKQWQSVCWANVTKLYKKKGKKKTTDTKATSELAAKSFYPNETFLATNRSSKPHDGIIDAVLIARYGLYQYKQGL